MRFLARARRDLGGELVARASLDDYLAARGVIADVRERFVVPLAAALWSLAPAHCGSFPAETYLRFLDQHGMLRAARPLAWRTIVGGSQRYVDALIAQLPPDTLRLSTPVTRIVRDARGVIIVARTSTAASSTAAPSHRYDRVILATHADTALSLLDAPSPDERAALGAFRYSTNHTVLHRDRSFLPRRASAHASWNYVADPDTAQVAVTYSMSRLQGLPDDPPYLVTLNPRAPPSSTIHAVSFTHPQFDRAALLAQSSLARLNGTNRTYYAGAHFGFGFHEDGLRSGLAAAARAIADDAGHR
jgi:predicted NAD/FAD-binding protein